ncbi:MAG: hypothetical protein HYU64_16630 [Armatimonadetes bacterium]|nr:hypothetical protein [Armatimonadota bacterium]
MRRILLRLGLLITVLMLLVQLGIADQKPILNLRFHDAKVADVLRFLTQKLGFNMIVDPQVQNTVTLNLVESTPTEALYAIMRLTGISMHQINRNTLFFFPGGSERVTQILPPVFIQLKHVRAEEMATRLKSLLKGIIVDFDKKSNTLIFFGDKPSLETAMQMINTLDRSADPFVTEIFPVKNSKAKDIVPILQSLFGSGGSSSGQTGAAQGSNVTSALELAPGPDVVQVPGYPQVTPPAGTSPQPQATPGAAATPSAPTVDANLRIQVDEPRNSIIINTTPENMERIRQFLAGLDRPIPQVMIEARVVDVSGSKLRTLGIDWPSTFPITTNLSSPNQPTVQGVITGNIGATLNLLLSRDQAKLLANSQVTTLNRQQATINIGEKIPLLETTTTTTGTTQSVRYENVGVILNIQPEINEDGFVTLNIRPEVSSVGATVSLAGGTYFRINTRQAQTNLRIKDGATIYLGGLIQSDERRSYKKVPLLGDIPVLGNLFSNRNTTYTDSELIFLITPHILYP